MVVSPRPVSPRANTVQRWKPFLFFLRAIDVAISYVNQQQDPTCFKNHEKIRFNESLVLLDDCSVPCNSHEGKFLFFFFAVVTDFFLVGGYKHVEADMKNFDF